MSGPLIAYLGHHKCGTVWTTKIFHAVCDIVGLKVKHAHNPELLGYDISASREQEGFDALSYTNANYGHIEGQDLIGFHVVRDPRDIIVSGYFSHLQSHPDNVWLELSAYRPVLNTVDKSAGLMMEMEFATDWMKDMRSWPDETPNVLLVKFEDLIQDQHAVYRQIFKHLGLLQNGLSGHQLDQIIEEHSFKNLSKGRPEGSEDLSSHFRKGVPGDWMNHFTPAHVWMFKHRYNDLLLKYGYEGSDRWEGGSDVQPVFTPAQRLQLGKASWLKVMRQLKRWLLP